MSSHLSSLPWKSSFLAQIGDSSYTDGVWTHLKPLMRNLAEFKSGYKGKQFRQLASTSARSPITEKNFPDGRTKHALLSYAMIDALFLLTEQPFLERPLGGVLSQISPFWPSVTETDNLKLVTWFGSNKLSWLSIVQNFSILLEKEAQEIELSPSSSLVPPSSQNLAGMFESLVLAVRDGHYASVKANFLSAAFHLAFINNHKSHHLPKKTATLLEKINSHCQLGFSTLAKKPGQLHNSLYMATTLSPILLLPHSYINYDISLKSFLQMWMTTQPKKGQTLIHIENALWQVIFKIAFEKESFESTIIPALNIISSHIAHKPLKESNEYLLCNCVSEVLKQEESELENEKRVPEIGVLWDTST
ncbi:hypothetical protein P691DRAFT_763945 [Macrolepiota fuliginosa MF-IS2]|uniref:Uncharacterized protein n=1 Tax=Macrolepiota fuliginosa MF-IS2 TaxID=1400762 RepID=A0A9P6BY42_9AGAR|nr:hypothetical protein P691DRAFT_763945 [Macrolepiota fuliginosa MF-IS2]